MIHHRLTDGQKRNKASAVDLLCICTKYLSNTHALDPIQIGLVGLSTHALFDAYAKTSLQKESDRGLSNLENLV